MTQQCEKTKTYRHSEEDSKVQIWPMKPLESQDLRMEGVCEAEDQEWTE